MIKQTFKMKTLKFSLALAILLCGCSGEFGSDVSALDFPVNTGTVVRVQQAARPLFFGIVSDNADRSRYEPINLPEQFQRDSTRIRFTGIYRDDLGSPNSWGRAVELYTVELF